MASEPIQRKWTVEEYLVYEREMDIKHEYIDGEIYAMSGGTDKHSRIASNCITELSLKLRESNCHVHTSDMRVQVSKTKYVYPDFSVVCGQAQFSDESNTNLLNPILVGEVMSPSSLGYDQGLKSQFYRSLSSLKYYLLVDQGRVHIQLYTLQENGWLLQEFTDLEVTLALDSIGVQLPISEIYRGLEFDSDIS